MRSITVILLFLACVLTYGQSYEIPAVFSDNMILQRDTKAPFWGKALPGEKITVKGSWGKEASAKAGDDSLWMCKIKTPGAGGPYEVTVTVGSNEIKYKNVLIGEVWICSGQSNMEMPLQGWPPSDTIFNSANDIASANNPNIRLFTVQRKISFDEEFNCGGAWQECSPKTAAGFSATAFYFGRKLSKELNVPVGLINTSWGGTPVEAWTRADYLAQTPYHPNLVQEYTNVRINAKKYKEWLLTHSKIDVNARPQKWQGLELGDASYKTETYDDSQWMTMNLPGYVEDNGLAGFDGAVWFRKKIDLPETWRGKELTMELGPIDDMDVTYVNGAQVGAYDKDGFWNADRVYTIPAALTQSGSLLASIRMMDGQGNGGFNASAGVMKLVNKETGEKVSLEGPWKYMPAAEWDGAYLYVFDKGKADIENRPKMGVVYSPISPSVLYNGMIHPLVPFAVKGAIWYQGEANTGEPEKYNELFSTMINNWREDWDEDLSFYYVQIAPYNYGPQTPSQKLREAQFKTLDVDNTGMVVTLDIGNPDNIHPGNKKDVGERLALWSLAKDFDKDVVYSGPLYKSMDVDGSEVTLKFKYADGLTVKPDNGKTYFMVAGADKVFKEAQVKVEGEKLIVSSPEVKEPVAVRYSWDNVSQASLFNGAGLPASSFRTDDWID